MNQRQIGTIIGVAILVVLLLSLLSGGMLLGWGMMGPGMMAWGRYAFYPIGWIVMLVFWVLIIVGIVALVAWLFRSAGPLVTAPARPSTALEILKERYARGEITREQYEQMRQEIEER